MSRIGKLPIEIPQGVTVEVKGQEVHAKGSKGELKKEFNSKIEIKLEGSTITLVPREKSRMANSLHGLTRTLIANMIEGVNKGFQKRMEIVGVGYRGQAAKNKITLSLGYSHPVEYTAPDEIVFEFDKDNKNILVITGVDKQTVGEVAAKIRSFRKPEPYKGKGIRYENEHIVRKAGKAAAKS